MAQKGAGGFQFAHVDWHSKAGAKVRHVKIASHGSQRGRGWSTKDILAEAARLDGHCGHVPHPQPPRSVYGCQLGEVEAIADAWADSITAKTGKKYRKDAPIMASGVVSLPRERIDEWPEYLATTIEALKEKYGERFRCAVEHLDESHPHVHFYLVPLKGEDFGVVHDGYAASRAARQGDNKVRTSFKQAMMQWQDWVQEKIGSKFGLARIGPRLRRLKGNAWKEEQENRAISLLEAKRDALVADIATKEASFADRESRFAEAEAKILKLGQDVERRGLLLVRNEEALALAKQTLASNSIKIMGKMTSAEKLQKQNTELLAQNEATKKELAEVFGTLDAVRKIQLQMHQPNMIKLLGVQDDPALNKIAGLGLFEP